MQKPTFIAGHLEPHKKVKGRLELNTGANLYTSHSKGPQHPKKRYYHTVLLTKQKKKQNKQNNNNKTLNLFQVLLGRTKSKPCPA